MSEKFINLIFNISLKFESIILDICPIFCDLIIEGENVLPNVYKGKFMSTPVEISFSSPGSIFPNSEDLKINPQSVKNGADACASCNFISSILQTVFSLKIYSEI